MNHLENLEKIYIDANSRISDVLRKLSVCAKSEKEINNIHYILILPTGLSFRLSNILFHVIAERLLSEKMELVIQTHDEKSLDIINSTPLVAVKELSQVTEDTYRFASLKLEEYNKALIEYLDRNANTSNIYATKDLIEQRKSLEITDVEIITEPKHVEDISELETETLVDDLQIFERSDEIEHESIRGDLINESITIPPTDEKSPEKGIIETAQLDLKEDSQQHENDKPTFEELYNLAISQKPKITPENIVRNFDISSELEKIFTTKDKPKNLQQDAYTRLKSNPLSAHYREVNGFNIMSGGDIASITDKRTTSNHLPKTNQENTLQFNINPFSAKSDNKETTPPDVNMKKNIKNSTNAAPTKKLDITKNVEPISKIKFRGISEEAPKKPAREKKNFKFSEFNLNRARLLIIFPLLFIILFFIYYFVPIVEITIKPVVREVTLNKDLIISTNTNSSSSENLLVSESLSLAKTILKDKLVETSVDIGAEARGKITLSNKTFQEIIIPAGSKVTISIAGKDLSYSTTSLAKVPPSISSFAGITNGIIDVGVTAIAKGDEYNIPAQSGSNRFIIDGFERSSIEGTNFTSFSGGFSKIVKKVTENDLTSLLTSAKDELKATLLAEITERYQNDYILINPEGEFITTKETYSSNIGDQTDKVTLDLSMKINVFGLSKKAIETLASNLFIDTQKDIIASSGEFTQQDNRKFEYSFDIISKEENQIKATLKIKGKFLHKLNSDILSENLSGSNISQTKNQVSELTNGDFEVVRIEYTPSWFPSQIKNIPTNSSNIRYLLEKINL